MRNRKSRFSPSQGYDDVESLVVNAGVIMALLLSFVVAGLMTYEHGDWDRVLFRQALYSWPNDNFREFVLFTLADEGVNLTLALDARILLDLASILRDRVETPITWAYRKSKLESAAEHILGAFPMARMHAWLVHPENRSDFDNINGIWVPQMFINQMVGATIISVVCLVAALFSYVSLSVSDAREDESGAALAAWSKHGIPVTLLIYLMGLIALVMFMVALGSAVWTQDSAAFGESQIYSIFMYAIAIPFIAIFMAVYVWSFRNAQKASSIFKLTKGMEAMVDVTVEGTATTQCGD